MKKERKCKVCNSSYGDLYLCDTCGKDLLLKYSGIPITISFSYGSNLDGEEYHFCNYDCLLEFIITERKKEVKNDKK